MKKRILFLSVLMLIFFSFHFGRICAIKEFILHRHYLNFIGSGITCIDNNGKTECTITTTGDGGGTSLERKN